LGIEYYNFFDLFFIKLLYFYDLSCKFSWLTWRLNNLIRQSIPWNCKEMKRNEGNSQTSQLINFISLIVCFIARCGFCSLSFDRNHTRWPFSHCLKLFHSFLCRQKVNNIYNTKILELVDFSSFTEKNKKKKKKKNTFRIGTEFAYVL